MSQTSVYAGVFFHGGKKLGEFVKSSIEKLKVMPYNPGIGRQWAELLFGALFRARLASDISKTVYFYKAGPIEITIHE